MFKVDNKILVLGGNIAFDGEISEFRHGKPLRFELIKSYELLSHNPLTSFPGGEFLMTTNIEEEDEDTLME